MWSKNAFAAGPGKKEKNMKLTETMEGGGRARDAGIGQRGAAKP